MISRLARWWLARSERSARRRAGTRFDECETCGQPGSHRVASGFEDGIEAEAGGGGGTFMSADFCPQHCPGGCRQGCATLVS